MTEDSRTLRSNVTSPSVRSSNPVAETALRKSNKKFMNRFKALELEYKKRGEKIGDSNLKEMDKIWNNIKKQT